MVAVNHVQNFVSEIDSPENIYKLHLTYKRIIRNEDD